MLKWWSCRGQSKIYINFLYLCRFDYFCNLVYIIKPANTMWFYNGLVMLAIIHPVIKPWILTIVLTFWNWWFNNAYTVEYATFKRFKSYLFIVENSISSLTTNDARALPKAGDILVWTETCITKPNVRWTEKGAVLTWEWVHSKIAVSFPMPSVTKSSKDGTFGRQKLICIRLYFWRQGMSCAARSNMDRVLLRPDIPWNQCSCGYLPGGYIPLYFNVTRTLPVPYLLSLRFRQFPVDFFIDFLKIASVFLICAWVIKMTQKCL